MLPCIVSAQDPFAPVLDEFAMAEACREHALLFNYPVMGHHVEYEEDDEYEEDENNLSDDEASESDEDEQLNTKKIAKADIAAQAQPQSRYPTKRNRKQNVQINVDHPKYRTGWGASDTQKKKAVLR